MMRAVTSIFRVLSRSFVVAAAVLFTVHLGAQQAERNYSLEETTSTELGKVQPLIDANKTQEALAIIDAQIKKVPPDSFDMAILLQFKAQIFLQGKQQKNGIQPLEDALVLSDAHTPTYFDKRVSLQFVYFLGQLYFQEASATKDRRLAETLFDKAESYMARWVKSAPKMTAEPVLFYASLLYNRATQSDTHIDKARLDKCLELVDMGLKLDTHPKENFYLLKLACLLQLTRYADAGEVLETVLARNPNNRNYWEQLAAIYLTLGQEIRAVVTIERAQSHGFMDTPKENFNLVGIYFNLGQYEKAADLLEAGLKNGALVSDLKGWELLSNAYQLMHRDYKSIDALNRAIKALPESGQLEYMLAQGYFAREKNIEALKHIEAAIRKGNLDKPGQAYLFLAYLAFDAKKFDVALNAAEKAIGYPDSEKEGSRMKAAIQDAITEREAKLMKM